MFTEPQAVTVEITDRIAVVRLNRPSAMNAINADLRSMLTRTLGELDRGNDADAIVLTGAGDRAFRAGQDLDESAAIDTTTLPDWLNRQHAMYQAVRDVDKLIIAAINGAAVGAGFQIALLCDLRVAHATLKMGQPEVKAGLASIVGSYLLSLQIGHSLNQQLSLTGELITGERAGQLGLVNDLITPEQVLPRAIERARALASLPGQALRATKQRFRERTQSGFEEACSAGIRFQLQCYSTGEPRRVMQAFLARRDSKQTN
jgi:enoyl-CoA hydratase/carnithine racemase